jgi:hypothetical protein
MHPACSTDIQFGKRAMKPVETFPVCKRLLGRQDFTCTGAAMHVMATLRGRQHGRALSTDWNQIPKYLFCTWLMTTSRSSDLQVLSCYSTHSIVPPCISPYRAWTITPMIPRRDRGLWLYILKADTSATSSG